MSDVETARAIAKLISDFHVEVHDKIRTDVERELAKLEEDDFDPTRGRGRGPRWMNGG